MTTPITMTLLVSHKNDQIGKAFIIITKRLEMLGYFFDLVQMFLLLL